MTRKFEYNKKSNLRIQFFLFIAFLEPSLLCPSHVGRFQYVPAQQTDQIQYLRCITFKNAHLIKIFIKILKQLSPVSSVVERWTFNPTVVGSTPTSGGYFFYFFRSKLLMSSHHDIILKRSTPPIIFLKNCSPTKVINILVTREGLTIKTIG